MSAPHTPTPAPWRRRLAPPALLGVLTFLLAASGALHRIDLVLYDALLVVNRPAPSGEIALVVIDERSLQQLGRWPWPRALHADLLDRLREAGARAVALQIIFAEPGNADDDAQLAAAIARFGHVVLPVFPEADREGGGLRAALPLPALASAAHLGHVDTELDQDGVARGIYLKGGVGESNWSHLGLALLEAGERGPVALPGERRPAATPTGSRSWLRDYRALVPFAASGFATVSYADVLSDPAAAASLRDKLVLVGVTAAGFADELATPVVRDGARMAGVEFNAHVVNALLQQRLVEPLPVPVSLVLSMLLASLPLLLSGRVRTPLVPAVLAIVCALGTLLLAAAMLRSANLWFPPAAAVVGALLSYPLWSWLQLRSTAAELARERERIERHAAGDWGCSDRDRPGRPRGLSQPCGGSTDRHDRGAGGRARAGRCLQLRRRARPCATAGSRGVRAGAARAGRVGPPRAADATQRRDPHRARERSAGRAIRGVRSTAQCSP